MAFFHCLLNSFSASAQKSRSHLVISLEKKSETEYLITELPQPIISGFRFQNKNNLLCDFLIFAFQNFEYKLQERKTHEKM